VWRTEHSIETTASAEAIWRLWADVPGWPDWIADIAHVEISGPFAVGGLISMTPIGQDPVELRIEEPIEPELFIDVAELGDVVVRTIHRVDGLDHRQNRVVYRMEISGRAADEIGSALGPEISGDFPQTLAALVNRAEDGDRRHVSSVGDDRGSRSNHPLSAAECSGSQGVRRRAGAAAIAAGDDPGRRVDPNGPKKRGQKEARRSDEQAQAEHHDVD
jgi:hypothetical protein